MIDPFKANLVMWRVEYTNNKQKRHLKWIWFCTETHWKCLNDTENHDCQKQLPLISELHSEYPLTRKSTVMPAIKPATNSNPDPKAHKDYASAS